MRVSTTNKILGMTALLSASTALWMLGRRLAERTPDMIAADATETLAIALLSFGIVAMLVCMFEQWHLVTLRLSPVRADSPDPRPRWNEALHSAAFSLAVCVLAAQFGAIVSAALPFTYTLLSSTTESKNSKKVIMGDFDGDGDLDYVAGNKDGGGTAMLDLYLNDGTGNYTHSTFGRSSQFEDLDAGDVDGDGDLDLVGAYGTNCLRTYFNNGSGVFTDPNNSSECAMIGASYSVVRLADVDSDGDLDRVMMSDTYVLTNAVELNNGAGSFTPVASTLPVGWAMVMADFDSDADLDLAFTRPNGHELFLYKNSGTGAFTLQSTITIATTPYNKHLSAGDLDNDGDIDIVLSGDGGQVYPIFNNGSGTMTAAAALSGPTQIMSTALVDTDSDGDLDLVLASADSLGLLGGTRVWLNSGAGTFSDGSTPTTERSDCIKSVAVGDVDTDGDPDYVAGNDDPSCIGGGGFNRLYVSNQATILPNAIPAAPASGFSASGGVNALGFSPVYGIMGANDASVGTIAWVNPANVGTSDNAYATATLTGVQTSNYLVVSSFPFSIPNGTVISGIVVEFEKRATAASTFIHDKSVRLLKNGVISGSDKATVTDWPTAADLFISYGSSTDLWGQTWTATDINNGISVAIAADKTLSPGTTTAYLDSARITVYYASGANVNLLWGSGSDTITPTRQLQYQVRMGTTPGGNNVISGKVASPNYTDRMMPNGQSLRRLVRNLTCGQTYYWGVKTVDSGLRLSTESSEQTFTLSSACTIGASLLYGYAGTSAGGGGGGGAAWLQSLLQDGGGAAEPTGKIAGQLFVDVNGNGKKEKGERGGFGGVRVEATGEDSNGSAVTQAVVADVSGKFQMTLPAGTYNVSAVDPSGVLHGYKATVGASDVTVGAGEVVTVDFGWRNEKLLGGYKPCLAIGEVNLETGKPVSQAILLGVKNLYGQTLVKEGALSDPLVTRKEFVELLAGTQCLSLLKSGDGLREDLRAAAKANGWLSGVLSDVAVPETLAGGSSWGNSAYALLAQGVPVGRSVGNGLAADGNAPVTKREAMAMVAAVLGVKADGELVLSLPPDANADDATSGTFVALKKAGVLPRGFEASIGGGVIPSEAADLLVKAAFAGGKLTLSALPDEVRWDQSAEADYLSLAGAIDRRPCLVQDASRATAVRSDILPSAAGDLFERLQLLLSLGTNDAEGRTRWLVTGRPSEYGVRAGNIGLSAGKAVTWVGLVDIGMKLTCHPLETFQEASKRLSGGGVDLGNGGTANMIFAPDRVFGTDDGVTYVKRLLHSFQRPIREFNLTPLAFAQDLTLEAQKDFSAPVSQSDASRLLASYVLYTRVKTGAMTRLEAEGTFAELQASILKKLTGVSDGDLWRMASVGNGKALTWGQLITVASDVLGPELQETPLPEMSTGEAWWGVVSH